MTTPRKKPSKAEKPKDPKKVANGKRSVRKGKVFERDVANLLGHIFPEAKRNLEFQADEAIHSKDIAGTDVYKIQCKNYQNYVNPSVIFEVKLSRPEDVPVLVTKGNRLPPMAVLPLGDLIDLLEYKYGLREPKVSIAERANSVHALTARNLPPFAALPLMSNDEDIIEVETEAPKPEGLTLLLDLV